MPDYVDSCIFCKIAAGEFNTEFLAETANVVAFNDINPIAAVHVLIVPKVHVESVHHLGEAHRDAWQDMLTVAQEVATTLGVAESGYRLVTNAGSDAGQDVFHLHLHLLGGQRLGSIAAPKKQGNPT